MVKSCNIQVVDNPRTTFTFKISTWALCKICKIYFWSPSVFHFWPTLNIYPDSRSMVHGWPKQGHSPIESFRYRLYAICILGHLFFVRTVSGSLLPLPSASTVPVLFIDCLVFARTLSGDNISPVQTWRWLRLIMHSKFQLMWLRNFVVCGKLWTAETMEIIISRYATMRTRFGGWWLKYNKVDTTNRCEALKYYTFLKYVIY